MYSGESIEADLRSARGGDAAALDRLLPLVYDELKRVARGLMRRERENHTLQTTALVHEAWLRMAVQASADPGDRLYFFSLAATMMRRILVNHARDRAAQKRGDGIELVSLSAAEQIVGARNYLPVFLAGEKVVGLADMDKAVILFADDHSGRAGNLA